MRMTSSFSPSNVFFLDRLTLYLLCCLLAVVPTTLRADEQTALSGDDRQIRKPVNCEKLRDGNYVWGCSRFYSICSNSNEMPMRCYNNLVLNPESNQCDRAADVPVCSPGNDQEKLWRTKDPFTCTGQPDRLFESAACANVYYECSRGQKFDRYCPQGLVFHQKSQACDYETNCRPATGKEPHRKTAPPPGMRRSDDSPAMASSSTGYGGDYDQQDAPVIDGFQDPVSPEAPVSSANSYYGAPQPPATDQQEPVDTVESDDPTDSDPTDSVDPVAPHFDCSSKKNGIFVHPTGSCAKSFWSCGNGQGFEYQCPEGLFYNADNNQCDYRQFVVACGGSPHPTTTTTTPTPPHFDCRGKKDGYYGQGRANCSPQFISCVAGHPTVMVCAGKLVFDSKTGDCDYPDSCGKPKPTLPPPDYNPGMDHGYGSYYLHQPSNNYIYGAPAPPAAAAGSGPPAPPLSSTTPGGQTPSQPGNSPSVPAGNSGGPGGNTPSTGGVSPPQNKFSCATRRDGYYFEKACFPSFYICGNGQANALKCSANTVFDPKTISCQYPQTCKDNNAPSGGTGGGPTPPSTAFPGSGLPGTPPSPPSAGGGQPPPSLPASAPAPAQQPAPVPPPTFNCQNKPDDQYAETPCTSTFVMCVAGHAIPQKCPETLIYDATTKTCETKSNCGNVQPPTQPPGSQFPPGTQPPGSQPPPTAGGQPQPPPTGFPQPPGTQPSSPAGFGTIPAADSSPPSGQPQPPASIPLTPVSGGKFSCSGRPNGFYFARPCTQTYIVCANGQTFPQNCPGNLKFDASTASCQFESSCGKPTGGGQTPPAEGQNPPPPTSSTPGSTPPVTQIPSFPPSSSTGPVPPPASPGSPAGSPSSPAPPSGPAAQPAPAPPSTQIPGGEKEFNCTGKPEGYYYTKPCQNSFVICAGHPKAFRQSCPSTLVFSPSSASCEYPEECVQPASVKPGQPPATGVPSPSTPGQPSQPPPKTPATQIPPQPSQPGSGKPFSCAGKRDGYYYPKRCGHRYIVCSVGAKFSLKCPASLVFEPTSLACQFSESCENAPPPSTNPANGATPPSTPGFPSPTPEASPLPAGSSSPSTTPGGGSPGTFATAIPSPTNNPEKPKHPFACGGKKDGYYYPKQCGSRYVVCSGGARFNLRCPASLVFDAKTAACQYGDSCGEGSSPPNSSSSTPPPQQGAGTPPASNSPQPSGGAVQIPPSEAEIPAPEESQQPPSSVQIPPSAATNSAPIVASPINGEQPPRPAFTQTPNAARKTFNCLGRRDGIYYPRSCGPTYVVCGGGHMTRLRCPGQLVFDASNVACQFPDQCVPNKGQGPPPPSGPSPQQPAGPGSPPPNGGGSTTPPPQPIPSKTPSAGSPTFQCSDKQDGLYFSEACQSSYSMCSNGQSYTQSCPGDLVFDTTTNACNFKTDCKKSGKPAGPSPPSSSTPPGTSPQTPGGPPPTSTTPPAPGSGRRFTCAGKSDGFYYTQACSEKYIVCSAGQTNRLSCAGKLVFDPSTVACQHKESCSQKPPQNPQPPTTTSPGFGPPPPPSSNTPGFSQPTPGAPSPFPPSLPAAGPPSPQLPAVAKKPPLSINCVGKGEGIYYQRPCQKSYAICASGQSFEQECPSDLVFDPSIAACQFEKDCKAKPAQPASVSLIPPPLPTPPPTQVGGQPPTPSNTGFTPSSSVQPVPPQTLPPLPKPDFNCHGRFDGYYYRQACKPLFFTCITGHATQLTCPGNLVFDAHTAGCEHPETCGKTSASPEGSSSPNAPAPRAPPTADFECTGKRNGYYVKEHCKQFFYTCLGGLATKLSCPGRLVFDQQSISCQYPEICGRPNGTTPSPPSSPGSSPGSPSAPGPEGEGGFNFVPFSPAGQPGGQQPATGGSPPGASPGGVPGQFVPPGGSPSSPPPTAKFGPKFCEKLTDGVYGQGCNNRFATCAKGKTTELNCFPALMFNEESGICEHPHQIPACGAFQPGGSGGGQGPAPQPAPQSPSAATPVYGGGGGGNTGGPYATVQMPPPPAPSHPPPPPAVQPPPTAPAPPPPSPPQLPANFTCSGRRPGYYSNGCSEKYVSCLAPAIFYVKDCPSGLKYGQDAGRCDYDSNVPECGGQRPPAEDVVKPPSEAVPVPVAPPPAEVGNHQPETTPKEEDVPVPIIFPEQPHDEEVVVPPASPPAPKPPGLSIPPNVMPFVGSTPELSGGNPCKTMTNGIHGKTCGQFYTICWAGVTYEFACPGGYAFNAPTNNCVHISLLHQCYGGGGGQKPPSPPPQRPPSPPPRPPPVRPPPPPPTHYSHPPTAATMTASVYGPPQQYGYRSGTPAKDDDSEEEELGLMRDQERRYNPQRG